ncbi:hypothetical protein B0F90DRAFT_169676 [Multifurca ochricompacta]|uniref:Uncharacterized protein n=1 Tax=Multifurca ochricompacta TaxID=376703 RepID=A0AAD4M5S7_9AGAM|nr:hypothetical protein B0F90DRAFT_169676 [Multifurca ochricompacta]
MTANAGPALTLEVAAMLRFPPFPTAPDPDSFISFASFKPSGIRVPIDVDDDIDYTTREIERDGLGIPTIALRMKHVADNAEKKKRKKKGGNVGAQTVQVAPKKPKTWWEIWEELEDIRRNVYDENQAAIDRLHQAGVDFKIGRTWPAAAQGVQHVWDIFRIYIGLLQQIPASKKDATPGAEARSDEIDSDDDDDDDDSDNALAVDKSEINLSESFLSNPELSMRIFFSSYFRERGFIWSEPRCVAMPILVSFFLRYLIRSRVFPEPEYERPLKRALEVVQLACVELPNSWKMGRSLPDAFSDGCKGLWGSMQPMWVPAPTDPSSDNKLDEREAKRQKLEDNLEVPPESHSDKPSAANVEDVYANIVAELKESAPSPTGNVGWGTAAAERQDEEPDEGWGTSWKEEEDDGAPIDTSAFIEEDEEDTVHELVPPIWDASIVEAQATWDLEPPTLLPLLGPSALPLTHTTGVVEQSTRRIVRVEPPRAPRLLALNVTAVEAVEEDLACRFARLVLAPWERLDRRTYEVGSDVLPATVLSTSRGAVVLEDEGEGEGEGEGEREGLSTGSHNPWKDEIVVLVDPKLTDVLFVGMGLGAIWVEIVRDKEVEGGGAGAGAGSTKKKGKSKKKEVPKYWYMEQLVHQLPSFYIDKPEEF